MKDSLSEALHRKRMRGLDVVAIRGGAEPLSGHDEIEGHPHSGYSSHAAGEEQMESGEMGEGPAHEAVESDYEKANEGELGHSDKPTVAGDPEAEAAPIHRGVQSAINKGKMGEHGRRLVSDANDLRGSAGDMSYNEVFGNEGEQYSEQKRRPTSLHVRAAMAGYKAKTKAMG